MFHKFKNLVRGSLEAKLPDIDCLPPAHLSAHLRADVGLFTNFESNSARQEHRLGAIAGLWR